MGSGKLKGVTITTLLPLCLLLFNSAFSFDLDKSRTGKVQKRSTALSGPIVEDDWDWHKIGRLWNRVTNFSYMGDDAYTDRTPSCDWPGGSGNSYLYRGTIWLTAKVDGVVHCTMGDDHEFAPIDSVHMIKPGIVSDEDTYTKYYDVCAPLASDHFPLGVEITERTYAWGASYAYDFIIYEYTIRNVGIDTDGDCYPDTPRDLEEFYFTIRLDADVSKLPNWGAEYRFSNQDDHVMANAGSWDWINLFPQMAGRDMSFFTEDRLDSTLIFMWDGDNPNYPADNGVEDDFGNPGPDGVLQSPGFIGIRVLKTEPYLPPSSFHVCHIYNDPATDKEAWDRMVSKKEFEPILVDPNGVPFPHDYRGIITFGPLDTLKYGDSVKVYTALGVGCDPDSGGIYSLKQLLKIMDVAKFIVDNNFDISPEVFTPPDPEVEVEEYVVNNKVEGVRIVWDDKASKHQYFQGYRIWKSSGKTASGDYNWQLLKEYVDTTGSGSWPPDSSSEPGKFEFIDPDVVNGFDYYYSVQAFTKAITYPIEFGVIETNRLSEKSFRYISPANPVATTLDRIKVVPNPYIGSAKWNNPLPGDQSPWEHRIQFINLPEDAKIKIFTLDGDFVDEIHAGQSARLEGENPGVGAKSVAEWDLITRNNQEAAPGIYIYVVESSLGTKVGKFIIVR